MIGSTLLLGIGVWIPLNETIDTVICSSSTSVLPHTKVFEENGTVYSVRQINSTVIVSYVKLIFH